MRQSQFLQVIDRDEATRRFHAALTPAPLGEETVPLAAALGRVLAADVRAALDVPGFTRSNVDGYAVRAADTFGCGEDAPVLLRTSAEHLATGVIPRLVVEAGTATALATGGIVPRGADAVVMVEDTEPVTGKHAIQVRRPVVPGAHVTQAGSDIARGETVLRRGMRLTSRETGVLAALGINDAVVHRRPRVAILSTGNEIVAPGKRLRDGQIHDANRTLLADSVRELGGEPADLGIVADDVAQVRAKLEAALATADLVLLSGGTSKGAGDVNAEAVAQLPSPGILAHGVALKPGKPVCLAAAGKTPVVILPGFPTSALFTFHEFVAPLIRIYAGLPAEIRARCRATLPARLNSVVGRTEYVLVGLVQGTGDLPVAVPLGKGSGSVTAFAAADGFLTIPRQTEFVEGHTPVSVTLMSPDLRPADLVVMGSHCLGLDLLLAHLRERGFTARLLAVGSRSGLEAIRAGHADLAGVHLLDWKTGLYNESFVPDGARLLHGYGRMQGLVFRAGDARFSGVDVASATAFVRRAAADCVLINRNRGSGTRALIDDLLAGAKPAGATVEARSHHAVASAVERGRADWGVAIETVARASGLGFLPLKEERFDFIVAPHRTEHPALVAFEELLADAAVRRDLRDQGFTD
ncbi:MAG: molybdopterin biosynthesis protein [Acidobacteriota bacterium]